MVTILCHFMVSCLLLIFDETMLGLFLGMIIYDSEFLACNFIVLDICSYLLCGLCENVGLLYWAK